MTLAVSCQLLTVEVQVYSKAVHVTFSVDSGIGTGFSWGPSVLSCHYHSSSVPYSLIYCLGHGQ